MLQLANLCLMFVRLLYFAGLAIGMVSLIALLGGSFWAFDLMSHFRMQYVVLLLLCSALLLILKRRHYAGVIVSFAAFNIFLILPLYSGGSTPMAAASEGKSVRLMSINLLSSNHESEAVFRAVADVKPGVLVFLEVNGWWQQELDTEFGSTYPYNYSRAREDNFGISMYSQTPLEDFRIIDLGDQIPSMLATIQNDGQPFHLLAVHFLPPMGKRGTVRRDASFAKLAHAIADLPHEILVLGDLNATPWSYPFRRLLADSNLHDSSVGFGYQPTWPTYFSVMGIPIDHCLHSRGVQIINREVGAEIGSDHLPLVVDFQLK